MIEALVERVESLERRIDQLENRMRSEQIEVVARTLKELSVREFVQEKKPDNDIQRALVIGCYLERYRDMPAFNAEDLRNGFMTAKLVPPKNMNDTANQNIRKGHMMEVGEKKNGLKAWTVTDSGEKLVDRGFVERE